GALESIQIASVIGRGGAQKGGEEMVEVTRKGRDVLVDGLNKIGWQVPKPRGTMFVWAPIPEPFRAMGSLEFAKLCIQEAKVAVSPGIGFGEYGDGYVRFALVENEQRIKQPLRGLKNINRSAPERASRDVRRRSPHRPAGPRHRRRRRRENSRHAAAASRGARRLPAHARRDRRHRPHPSARGP